ncbi:Yae1 family protein [Longirhabdus pacifica]|uniref:Yae1 family protein n=1 Tax=Longirhabdus pacifica TaxID=2305227 RepID=UPI001008850E|nr:Yae1 family protein [Longirhabdus pacifica]
MSRPWKHNMYDRGYDDGYDRGYKEGYKEGYNEGYQKAKDEKIKLSSAYHMGWEEGLYSGGEGVLEYTLLKNKILMHVNHREILQKGLASYKNNIVPIQSLQEVWDQLYDALEKKIAYSFIRLGDGELLTLAQGNVLSDKDIKKYGPFLPYAGVTIPNTHAKSLLLTSLIKATLIGIPLKRSFPFQRLAEQVLKTNNINLKSLPLTNSLINYQMYENNLILKLLKDRKILIIGNVAALFARKLTQHYHLSVSGYIQPVDGFSNLQEVIQQAGQFDYDIALISAGVAAVVIAEKVASTYGKVAIDFGHVADLMIRDSSC